jgi:glutamyl-tRNA synthetase
MIRTRFAPSPTGYLHLGGARTALYSWAFARRHGGTFVLRIEDTDRERSTEDSVKAILDGMNWLGLDWDEGPIFQMDRLSRYREVAEQLIRDGKAYYCYSSKEELDQMRESQRAAGAKPRYDGRWRPENAAAAGLKIPKEVTPVIRFRNPDSGAVTFNDLVKGDITVSNAELDDFVLMRGDGVPTYNFGVVVDDLDMSITHVIRGDDHVNNTPRQINVMMALGASLPLFAHVPMILGADGERLSKRHGAVSVMQYKEDGFLPPAMLNYLARLGWSHGNEEFFTPGQFVEWFDLAHVSRSPAQFNPEKLAWLNQQHLRAAPDAELASAVLPLLVKAGYDTNRGVHLEEAVSLFKDRAGTLIELAESAAMFFSEPAASQDLLSKHVTEELKPLLRALADRLEGTDPWTPDNVLTQIKEMLKTSGLKMPRLAIPVRVCVFGSEQTPDLAKVLALLGKSTVVARLRRYTR